MTDLNSPWLSRKGAASYLATLGYDISPGHLTNLAVNNNAGKGPPFVRIRGRTIRYRREDLKKWYEARVEKVE